MKFVFIRNRNNPDKHICLLSTNLQLSNEQIIRIYARRWNIEVAFKIQKSLLGLESCSAKHYSSIIAHTNLICVCAMILEYIKRDTNDPRCFGPIFKDCATQLEEIHLNIALDTLINTFMDYVDALRDNKLLRKNCYEKAKSMAYDMLGTWFTSQLTTIQDFLSSLYEEIFPKKDAPLP